MPSAKIEDLDNAPPEKRLNKLKILVFEWKIAESSDKLIPGTGIWVPIL